jgi:hypothetical protein
MKKHLKLNKDERLHEWIKRLTAYYDNNNVPTKEMEEIIREVSVHSYIHSTNDAHKVCGGVIAR